MRRKYHRQSKRTTELTTFRQAHASDTFRIPDAGKCSVCLCWCLGFDAQLSDDPDLAMRRSNNSAIVAEALQKGSIYPEGKSSDGVIDGL